MGSRLKALNVRVGAKRREVEMLAGNQKVLDGFFSSWKACREKSKKGQSRGASETLQGGRYQLSINKNLLMVSPPSPELRHP